MIELLTINKKGVTYTMKGVQEVFEKHFGEWWSILTLMKHLMKEYSQQKATFKDPHKWLLANCLIIKDFIIWQLETPWLHHYQVKVFDEACIDCTHLGNLVIWSHCRQQPLQERYQHDIMVESWMVNVLMILDAPFPLIFSFTADSSNSEKFIEFILDCIHAGDVILGDNCSFHQHGWSKDVAFEHINALGADYWLLPKYCPEFSPAEQVFSFLKAHLQSSFNPQDDLLPAITAILNK